MIIWHCQISYRTGSTIFYKLIIQSVEALKMFAICYWVVWGYQKLLKLVEIGLLTIDFQYLE